MKNSIVKRTSQITILPPAELSSYRPTYSLPQSCPPPPGKEPANPVSPTSPAF